MILYELACTNAHQFEAWFRDIATYDAQSAAGDVICPFCGSTGVTQRICAVNDLDAGTREDGEPEPHPVDPA